VNEVSKREKIEKEGMAIYKKYYIVVRGQQHAIPNKAINFVFCGNLLSKRNSFACT